MSTTTPIVMLRRPAALARLGYGTTSLYSGITRGLMTPGVMLGVDQRFVAWPEHEIDAVNAARIAGASDHQIKILVLKLKAARREFMPELIADVPPTADSAEPLPQREQKAGPGRPKKIASAPVPVAA